MTTFAAQFSEQAEVITRDLRHRNLIQTALGKYEVQRTRRAG